MHTVDTLTADFPHGTPEGYDAGCRGWCPSADLGLSCKQAKLLDASDYRYRKLRATGATPAHIANELGLQKETPMTDEPHDDVDDVDEPDAAPDESGTFEVFHREELRDRLAPYLHGLSQRARHDKLAEIREWCREHGYPGIADRGTLPFAAVADYVDAHPLIPSIEPPQRDIDEPETDIDAPNRDTDAAERVTPTADELEAFWTDEPEATDAAPAGNAYTDMLDPARERAGLEIASERLDDDRPEWADITIAEDVAVARAIAARLEEELAHVTEERDQALSALAVALPKWEAEHAAHEAAAAQLASARAHVAEDAETRERLESRIRDLEARLAGAQSLGEAALAEVDRLRGLIEAAAFRGWFRRWPR